MFRCAFWASKGECTANPRFMHATCGKSCGTCDQLQQRKTTGVTADVEAMVAKTTAFGEKQTVEGASMEETIERVRKSMEYMNSHEALQLPKDLYSNCRNRNALCSFWSALGKSLFFSAPHSKLTTSTSFSARVEMRFDFSN